MPPRRRRASRSRGCSARSKAPSCSSSSRGGPAGELADPEHAAAPGRACGALHERLAGVAAPAGLRELPGRERSLLHLDLHPYNVLVDDDGAVTAVIDWTNAAAGDPQLDAVRTWSILRLDPAALALRTEPGWVALSVRVEGTP